MQTRCPACGSLAAPTDTACRRCGAALPFASTAPSGDIPAAPASRPSNAEIEALTEELREALAPRIVLLEQLGEGGMGRVFLAREPALRRLVAVKVLNPALVGDTVAQARFAREAETAAAVGHPGVVGIYQVGELPKSRSAYFVMQFVEGTSLEQEIKPGEGMPAGRLQRIVGEVASALAAAHARGLVHRDIKPANIMVDAETGRVVVLDFGISAVLDRQAHGDARKLTTEGTTIGTPMYMSPEQGLAQKVTAESDIYSLGVVAFELATGRAPFKGDSWGELIAAHVKDAPPRLATLRPDLEGPVADLIDRCLAKEPGKRPSAADLARGLLPSAQALIEWPPPGLAPLRGLLWKLFAVMGSMAGLGLLLELVLWRQPTLVTISADPSTGLGFDTTLLWLFLLALCLTLILILIPMFLFRLGWLSEHWDWGRKAGYPIGVLLEVASDRRADLGDLINGTGAFLLFDPAERARLRDGRRTGTAIIAMTLVILLAAPLLWAIGIVGGWGNGGAGVLPTSELALLMSPWLVGAGAFAWSQARERGLTRSPRSRRWWSYRRSRPALPPGLIVAWLDGADRVRPRSAGKLASLAMEGVEAISLLVAIALIGGAAMALWAGLVAKRSGDRAKLQAEALVLAATTDSLHWVPWQTVDSVIASSALKVDPATPPDIATARAFLALQLERADLVPVWNVDSAAVPTKRPDTPFSNPYWRRVHVADALPARPTRGAMDSLAQDTIVPGLALWRRMAHSSPLPALWRFRQGMPGVQYSWELPWSVWDSKAASANLVASTLALANGDAPTALLRVRENIAIARGILASTSYGEWYSGFRLVKEALGPMRDIARVARRPGLAAEADRLESILERSRSDFASLVRGWHGLTADARAPVALHLMGDASLPPAVRMEGAFQLGFGFCQSPRELLFGIDPVRRETLSRAADALRDLPRSAELLRLYGNDLDRFSEGWWAVDLYSRDEVLLTWLGRHSAFFRRMTICRFV